jgi:hypothetical protein
MYLLSTPIVRYALYYVIEDDSLPSRVCLICRYRLIPLVMSSKRKWDQAAPEESWDEPESPSKVAKVEDGKSASTAAAAAAAIAAKIAAQYSGAAAGGGNGLLGPKDIHDGEFTQDIDINDVRNRYMLTKGSTQQQVRCHSHTNSRTMSQTNVCGRFS